MFFKAKWCARELLTLTAVFFNIPQQLVLPVFSPVYHKFSLVLLKGKDFRYFSIIGKVQGDSVGSYIECEKPIPTNISRTTQAFIPSCYPQLCLNRCMCNKKAKKEIHPKLGEGGIVPWYTIPWKRSKTRGLWTVKLLQGMQTQIWKERSFHWGFPLPQIMSS